MNTLIILTLLPILVILLLLIWKNMTPHICALIGWLLAVIIAFLFFQTSLEVCFRASAAGIISSFPISLMVVVSILQITLMEVTGALKRVSVFLKTLAPTDKAVQIMIINIGVGTLLVSVGATPVSVLPAIMVGLGYSKFIAIALPALGFDALCTFSMLGAPLITYSDFTKVPLVEAAQVFTRYLPVISTLIGFSMLWVVGRKKLMKEGFIPCLLAGLTAGLTAVAVAYIPFFSSGIVLTGVIAGANTILVMLIYLKILGKPIIDRSNLTTDEINIEKEVSLIKALSPWIILIASLLIVNFYTPLHTLLFEKLELPVSMIPGQYIKTRPFWNAYTWVLISTIAAAIILKPNSQEIKNTLWKWTIRAPKPAISTAAFFMLGLLMNNTGLENVQGLWRVVDPNNNMIAVLADASYKVFGSLYPLIAAPLGLFGGFVTGSEASTLAMFAKYNILTSDMLKLDPLVITAATGIGAGLASVCSPAKLQNAAAIIDAFGEENQVIKSTFKISVLLIAVTAVMCFFMS